MYMYNVYMYAHVHVHMNTQIHMCVHVRTQIINLHAFPACTAMALLGLSQTPVFMVPTYTQGLFSPQ